MAEIREINGKKYVELECPVSIKHIGVGMGIIMLPLDELRQAIFTFNIDEMPKHSQTPNTFFSSNDTEGTPV